METKKKSGKKNGPFSISLFFLDGTNLKIREQITEEEAYEVFREHSQGIGAQVGTTQQVIWTDEENHVIKHWIYISEREDD
jgi:hypothetical protein